MIKALIVDDEALARNRIRRCLSQEPQFEILGECSNGPEAIAFLREQTPDLIFLDVQMPEMTGFDLLEALPALQMPGVIFVTAHYQHALKAFEVHAIDYLVKPFTRHRLREAVRRARQQIQARRASSFDTHLRDLLKRPSRESSVANRIPVKSGNQTLLVKLEHIDYVESAANYVVLHTPGGNHVLRDTLTNLESKLPPSMFLRISRSVLVNLDRIKGWETTPRGDYELLLHNNQRLVMTRGHREAQERLQYSRIVGL